MMTHLHLAQENTIRTFTFAGFLVFLLRAMMTEVCSTIAAISDFVAHAMRLPLVCVQKEQRCSRRSLRSTSAVPQAPGRCDVFHRVCGCALK